MGRGALGRGRTGLGGGGKGNLVIKTSNYYNFRGCSQKNYRCLILYNFNAKSFPFTFLAFFFHGTYKVCDSF